MNLSVSPALRLGPRPTEYDPVVVLLGLRGAADPGRRAGQAAGWQAPHHHLCAGQRAGIAGAAHQRSDCKPQ